MVKSCWNVNFEEMDTDYQQGKIMDFQYCEEYLRSIFNKILLWQKSKFSFSCHLEIDEKKLIMKKKIQGENLFQTLFFLRLPSAYKVLMRKNVMLCIS